ncbi:DUF1778 domain-containing protein [uncultured Psychromonas sp.]|uniref:type II toxin-antitoxin system TacA family antitoxin n=1 Tax=uncultured Psychromonas sp. TaxID=173974 RepID=UPI0026146F80|nr:DUF1778 domain-containing protein [uncultured Psychromonas sp.]
MTTTRLDISLDQTIKSKAEKAAALLGFNSLSEYVVSLIDEDASNIIAEHEAIVVESDVFDLFIKACDKANRPSSALLAAKKFTVKSEVQ